jgi:sugar (pentulose or hexulose) kinase
LEECFILCVDIGTSSLKAALIDSQGRERAFSRAAYGAGEIAAADWEAAFARTLEDIARSVEGGKLKAAGVCVSGNGPTLIPETEDGTLPPLHWYGGKLAPAQGAKSLFLPLAAWFRQNRPGDYRRTRSFLSPPEWLSRRLGAEALSFLPSAAYEPWYWDEAQCALYDLDQRKFPPFIKTGSPAGRISAEALGLFPRAGEILSPGLPIVAGAPDFIASLIGAGALESGLVCDRAGSSEGINLCVRPSSSASFTPASRAGLRILPHAREGFWNLGAVIPSSGALFEAYLLETVRGRKDYQAILAELIPRPGEKLDLKAGNESLERGRETLMTMGFQVRFALETFGDLGFPVRERRLSGGQAKNRRWNQLKADITGVTLFAPEIRDGELAGDAVIAVSCLESRGIYETARGMIRVAEAFVPNPRLTQFYGEKYRCRCFRPGGARK